MSKRHLSLLMMFATLLGLGASAARAQQYTPFIEPNHFDNDHQYFAPAYWEDLGRVREANTGWFLDLHRMYVYMERPDPDTRLVGPGGGDWTWGNRFDVGYMTEANHGWLWSAYDINSPNAQITTRFEQINRVNEDFLDFIEDPTADDLELQLPVLDRNNPLTNARDFDADTTLNSAKLTNIEMMKVWRMRPLHNRGVLEPMLGMRYIKLRDMTLDESYLRLDEDGLPLDEPVDSDAEIEVLTFDNANFLNHLVLAQVGLRLQVPKGRWMLNHEMRAFCGPNWQEFSRSVSTLRIRYDGSGTNSEVELTDFNKQRTSGNGNEFVFGADARAEAAFLMTRDLSLSTGVHYQYMAQGIGRGNNLFENEQDFGMLSVVFGVVYNR